MFEIVVRTDEGRQLLRPVPRLTAGVLGVMGRALSLFSIELHAFTFLSNHGHLLLTAPTGAILSGFVCHLNRNTAAVIQRVTGWRRRVWTRAIATPVLDDDAAISRLRYILANGVKEGLVHHPLAWPGPSSAAALLTGAPIETSWELAVTHRAKSAENAVIERNPIRFAPLPVWRAMSLSDRCARVSAIVDDIVQEARKERAGRPFLGVAEVLAQDPFESVPLEETPPPLAHHSKAGAGAFARYQAERRAFHDAHLRASAELRSGQAPVAPGFPPCGFPAPAPFVTGG